MTDMPSLQTTSRARDNGASFAARRGHTPQLSISDDNHHVTEAIGYMYEDETRNDARRSPGGPGHHGHSVHARRRPTDSPPPESGYLPRRTSIPRKELPERKGSNSYVIRGPSPPTRPQPVREYSWEDRNGSGSRSPPMRNRERAPSDTATSQFPLNDIDYESSPAAVAQELSNLQALRRMSMSVGAAGDPDLPQLDAASLPSMPSADASEDDSSRLFWVPARLHPELAPTEFKSFLDSKTEQIKRRSGELSSASSPSSSRASSLSAGDAGGLRRKKSMLSRQIDSSAGYQDGADRLERKRSLSRKDHPAEPNPNLEELESLVSGDLSKRTSLESQALEENGDVILPSVPGSSLKRSTRTNYRRGGSVKGRVERPTYAQRAARRRTGDDIGSPITPSTPEVPPLPSFDSTDTPNLAQTLKDPSSTIPVPTQRSASNFSRPALSRTPSPPTKQPPSVTTTFEGILSQQDALNRNSTASMPERRREPMSHGQSPVGAGASHEQRQVPHIVEVPPPEDQSASRPTSAPSPAVQPPMRHPERVSSRDAKPLPMQRPGMASKTSSGMGVPQPSRSGAVSPPSFRQPQSLDQPSPLPGNDTNTGNLSFIPTLTVDKRADNQKKKEEGGKKSGWGWLLGKEDKEKEQEKSERPKAKIVKPPSSDNTRLDVLQTSIDGPSRKESLVLDRDGLKLEEERKKESQRKSAEMSGKKEKESLFSSIFGGKKGKADKEASKKTLRDRLSPEPTLRELKPDIDYHWTRFSILEERAIYRMAHIKLANPRRALHSQVLLSNFMYSYLAKVQQMHPQMNLPTNAKQQKKQQKQEQPQQPDEFTQYQRYQQVGHSILAD